MKITSEVLNDLLLYNKDTGKLYWKYRDEKYFKNNSVPHRDMWNTQNANNEALTCKHKLGYKQGWVLNKRLSAHRVIWCLVSGGWPENIDHVNGDPSDNRLDNLRNVTKKLNSRNQKLRLNNRSGINGVSWSKSNKKWMVQISTDSGRKTLGFFDSLEDATTCRQAHNLINNYHENHGKNKELPID